MAEVYLIPMGTPGDVQPFIEIGQRLLARGHEVKLVAHQPFAQWAARFGLGMVELGTAAQYQRLLDDENLWVPAKAHRVFARKLVVPTMQPMYDLLAAAQAKNPDCVVLGQTMALGARVAQEKLGIKLLTLHRQPAVLRSVYDSSTLPFLQLGRLVPTPLKQMQYRLLDALIDHTYRPQLDAMRAKVGLRPVRKIFSQWLHSPQGVLCMWPQWFAAPQPDWPANCVLAGFDVQSGGEADPPMELVRFLESGDKPIVFTTGSGMKHGRSFYQQSVQACKLLKRRGILATRFTDQVPTDLPPDVLHVRYAPFNWLLPKCAAAVHHAGIGTLAQCMAAGVPQLCMPGIVFDTADNARRACSLGVGSSIESGQYRAARVADLLRPLLEDQTVQAHCREIAARIASSDALNVVCQRIEQLEQASN